MKLTPELLGRRHSIVDAEHTYRIAAQAYGQGNLRLAVSRGITAVIQASIASMGAPEEVKERADRVIQGVRQIIHGAVLERAKRHLSELGVLSGRRPKAPLPRWLEEARETLKKTIADNQATVDHAIIKTIMSMKFETVPSDLEPLNTDEAQPFKIVPPVEFESNYGLRKMRGKPFLFESPAPLELHHLLMEEGVDPSTMAVTHEGVAVRPDVSVSAALTVSKMLLGAPKRATQVRSLLSDRTVRVMNETLRDFKRKIINTIVDNEVSRWRMKEFHEVTERKRPWESAILEPLKESIATASMIAKKSLPPSLRDKLTIQQKPGWETRPI